jgi:hypothetical protein
MRHWCLSLYLAAVCAASDPARGIEFNTRHDTALRGSPIWLQVFDEAASSLLVGDSVGIQLLRAEGNVFHLVGEQPTDAPVGALAAAELPGGRFIAYNVRGEQSVRIVAATARGTIGTGPNVAVPGRPRAILALPARGFIVVHSGGVDLLEAAAAGAFRRTRLSSIGGGVDAAVIDLDGDQHTDLVLADEPLGEIVILRGSEAGEMEQVAALRTQRAPQRVIAANIDGDAAIEIAVLGDRGISVHDRGDDGSVLTEKSILDASHLADLAAGDFDGNGIGDLAYTNRSRSVVSILLGTPSGRLLPGPSFLTGAGPGRLIVTVHSGDRRQGIVVANEIGNSLTNVRREPRGLIGVAVAVSAIGRLSDAAAADFNGDGHLDLAMVGDESGRLEIHLGMGNGHFQATPSYPVGMTPRAIATGDWDGDGRADMAIADFGADRVAILYGNGKGGLSVPVLIAAGSGPNAILHGDFGGPIGRDLAVANRLSEDITILHGDGDGRFAAGPSFPVGLRPTFLFSGDVDGDGDEDLVTGNRQYETITILPREGKGYGESYNRVLADSPQPSAAADLDGDGKPELVVTDGAGDKVMVLKGNNANFAPVTTIAVGRSPTSIEFGDFDADGRNDIAVVHQETGIVAILLRLEK